MNRQIKFRAWDGKRITTSGIMFNSSTGQLVVPETFNDPKMILMQFTGLIDINKVEVYDRDIVKVKVKTSFNSELLNEFRIIKGLSTINGIGLHFTGIVRVDMLRGLMFENPKNGYQEPFFTRHMKLQSCLSFIEVIGNIYEHPHLLKA